MNGQDAQESRRDAHESVDKKMVCHRILSTMQKVGYPVNAYHVSYITGLPLTTLRPRFTELANAEWCKRHMNWNQAMIKEAGRVNVEGARCKVTAYVLTLVENEG
jgi:hypothetical protein